MHLCARGAKFQSRTQVGAGEHYDESRMDSRGEVRAAHELIQPLAYRIGRVQGATPNM
jgi:hypothetical protein